METIKTILSIDGPLADIATFVRQIEEARDGDQLYFRFVPWTREKRTIADSEIEHDDLEVPDEEKLLLLVQSFIDNGLVVEGPTLDEVNGATTYVLGCFNIPLYELKDASTQNPSLTFTARYTLAGLQMVTTWSGGKWDMRHLAEPVTVN